MASIMKYAALVESVGEKEITVKFIGEAPEGVDAKTALELYADDADKFSIGEQVTVVAERHADMKVVARRYIYPFLLMLAVLMVASNMETSQTVAGLSALGAAAAYYIIVALTGGGYRGDILLYVKKQD